MKYKTKYIIQVLLFLLLFSCKDVKEQHLPPTLPQDGTITYSKNFSIEKQGENTLLTVRNPWKGAKVAFSYLTYPRGSQPPKPQDNVILIPVPIRSLACMSTTHIGLLNFLGMDSLVTSMSGTKYVYNEAVRQRIQAATIKELGHGDGLNYELLVESNPDVVLTYGMSEDNNIKKLQEIGLKPVVIAEYMDASPLGRAEWVKFLAVLTGQEVLAAQKFEEIAKEYERLKDMAQQVPTKTKVFTGMGFKGNWHVPEADSYVAQSIADAGGDYLWKNHAGSGSIMLDFEAVFDRSQEADAWINVGMVKSLKDIREVDERYTHFLAWKKGNVFNGSARVSDNGGYDIYESAVVNPHLVLQDLIRIFHPKLLQEGDWVYYEQLL